jgi:hypothetical protein
MNFRRVDVYRNTTKCLQRPDLRARRGLFPNVAHLACLCDFLASPRLLCNEKLFFCRAILWITLAPGDNLAHLGTTGAPEHDVVLGFLIRRGALCPK